MKWVVEFTDHNGKIRHTQPFETKIGAEIAVGWAQMLAPHKLESKVVPLMECNRGEAI